MSSTVVAAMICSCSMGSTEGSAKKLRTVWPRGSRPSSTFACSVPAGKCSPTSLNLEVAFPVDGSDPTYCASSGTTSSTLKAPTMKKVKSAAFANRSRKNAIIFSRLSASTRPGVSGCDV